MGSVKKGVLNLFMGISMAYNVISCQKVAENTQSLNSLCKSGSRPQKSPKKAQKNGSLNRDLLKFLNRYGIFWVPPGESSCPDGSEYVWQRGVESLQGPVLPARSWEMPVKCELPAKIGR